MLLKLEFIVVAQTNLSTSQAQLALKYIILAQADPGSYSDRFEPRL